MGKTNNIKTKSLNKTEPFLKKPKKILKKAKKDFHKWSKEPLSYKIDKEKFTAPPDFCLRITACPAEPITAQKRIFENNREGFFRCSHEIKFGEKLATIGIRPYTNQAKPRLRGAQYFKFDEDETLVLDILDEGLIQVRWRKVQNPPSQKPDGSPEAVRIYETRVLGLFLSVLEEIKKFRSFNNVAKTNFLLEFEIISPEKKFYFSPINSHSFYEQQSRNLSKWKSPLYEIGPSSKFGTYLDQFHRDIYDSAGWDAKPSISLK